MKQGHQAFERIGGAELSAELHRQSAGLWWRERVKEHLVEMGEGTDFRFA